MKILVSDSLDARCIDIFTSEQFTVDNRPGLPAAELLNVIGEYDGLVVRSATKVTAEVIERAGRMKIIGRAGTGVDNIDVPAATRRGILVMNTPGGNTVSAAEHTVSLMLSLARNIPQAHASLQRGEWDRKTFVGTEVQDKTVGLVGLGKIGLEVARRCQGLDMKVIGFDPVLAQDAAARLNIELVGLEEIFRRADFISVHTPLTPQTKGLLNDAAFAKCKKGVRIVNCARGGIVDEASLLRALENGIVGGAALDVFEQEPPKGNPLLAHPRVIATPHLGASTEEAQEKVAIQIAHQMVDAFQGRAFAGVVNGTAMHLTLNRELQPFLTLAERLGSLVAQMAVGRFKKVTIGAAGEPAVSSLELVKAGVLKGILTHSGPGTTNFISAPFLAKERGIVVDEEKLSDAGVYTNSVRVRFETDQEVREVTGTVIGAGAVRIVQMDGFGCEVRPEGHLLIYSNIDRPGMLGRVGTVLASHNVNIGSVSLGRTGVGATALTVMNVDTAVPDQALKELVGKEGILNVKMVRLD